MHDVRVALRGEQLGHVHRAILADAAQVVASQIDQHHVLGPLLGIIQQLLLQRGILGLALAPPACTGQGPDLGHAVLGTDQHLRRRANQAHGRIASELEEEHVGGGVDPAQGAVNGKRISIRRPCQALREHSLKDVACGNVLLGCTDCGLILGTGHVRLGLASRPSGRRRHGRQRRAQACLKRVEARYGVVIGRVEVGPRWHLCIGKEQQAVLHVVEHSQRVR